MLMAKCCLVESCIVAMKNLTENMSKTYFNLMLIVENGPSTNLVGESLCFSLDFLIYGFSVVDSVFCFS